jgi:DAACS family dicarboxylate/amino acid:cation (Na+ or H+) symporter
VLSGIAVGIGLVLVNLLAGRRRRPAGRAHDAAENAERSKAIVSRIQHAEGHGHAAVDRAEQRAAGRVDNGAILSLMFFALMFGIGMVLTDTRRCPLRRAIEGVFEISMTLINLVIRLAPYAVACFMFNLAALFGFELIIRLGAYVGVVVLALACTCS